MNVKTEKDVCYLHSTIHTGCLIPYEHVFDSNMFIDPKRLKLVQTKQNQVTRLCKTMGNKLFLMELVLFLMYLALLGISALALTYLPSLIVLIRVLRMVLVISECFLFIQERGIRKRIRLVNQTRFTQDHAI